MSEGYARENALVSEESNYYDRALDTSIALAVIGFLLGLVTITDAVGLDTSGGALNSLFLVLLVLGVGGVGIVGLFSYLGVVPVTSQRVRGVGLGLLVGLVALAVVSFPMGISLATLLGLVLIAQGLVIGAAGVASRMGVVETEPASSAGLLAGTAFGVIGLLIGLALGVTLFGGTLAWVVALAGGAGLFALTILPREDISSTLPAGILLVTLGGVIATAVIGVGWQWKPQAIDGGFTGGVVIPLFVLFGSMIAGWAAAKSRAGFGARGRQYGAFLIINLNALLMVVTMVSIVLFVASRGLTYAFHGFRIGALTALVLLSPLLIGTLNWARSPAGTDQWHSAARQFFRVLPLAALGALAALLLSVILTGNAIEIPFVYDVLQNRELVPVDTSFQVTPEPTVGTLLVVFPGTVLFVYFLRKYGSLSQVGAELPNQRAVQRALGLAMGATVLLTLLLVVLGGSPFGLPVGGTLGLAVVFAGSLLAAAGAVAAVGGLLVGEGGLAERAHERAQVVKVGLFGALGLLAVVVFLQPAAGVNPSLGPANLVPAVALLAAVAAVGVAVVSTLARRSVSPDAPGDRLRRRVIGEETTLGLAAAAGFVTIAALHVAVTRVDFTILGVTIGVTGTLSWPMVMSPYIPLGPEPGGILPAVVGTVWLVVGASLFAVPLGVGAAVFLTEYAEQGKFTALVEVATNALWSTPSVVFGLFGAAFLIPRLGGDEGLLVAMLVLGFMLLPLVLITSREAIKAVPDQYRDASAALGVNQWETIRSVVLPAALPGVITGVILGVGRIAGETAPLILVLGSTLNETQAIDVLGGFQFIAEPPFIYNGALLEASASLPTQVWAVIAAGVSGSPSMGWASAFVLLTVVLSFYAIGILSRSYFRRKLDYE
jgi:phosphate transport system permease protein